MQITRTRFLKLIRVVILIIVAVAILGYVAFRSLPYAKGPSISIYQPLNGATIASTTVTIIGKTSRVNSLTMNDDPIQVDEQGNFKETLIIFPGLNKISFFATDQFKRSVTYDLTIYGALNQ